MDGFCLYDNCRSPPCDSTNSRLLDIGLNALENADRHTFHCLLDVSVCVNSDFHILGDPQVDGAPYTVAFVVDDGGRNMLIEEGRASGKNGGCFTCTGPSSAPAVGFRAEVKGIVSALGDGTNENPPTLQVTSAKASNGRTGFCQDGTTTDPSPTPAPQQNPSATDSPQETPTLAPTNEECLSGESVVNVQDKGIIRVRDLVVGDRVQVDKFGKVFEVVYSIAHRNGNHVTEFLQIFIEGERMPLEITRGHLVYKRNMDIVSAGSLEVGDTLAAESGKSGTVSKIRTVRRRGFYAPYTYSGSFFSNGVQVSIFVNVPQVSGRSVHIIMWILMAYHRLVCKLNFEFCLQETHDNEGVTEILGMFKPVYKWAVNHGGWAFVILLPLVVGALALHLFELAVVDHFVLCTLGAFSICYCFGYVKRRNRVGISK